jgi:hypothetical protein
MSFDKSIGLNKETHKKLKVLKVEEELKTFNDTIELLLEEYYEDRT